VRAVPSFGPVDLVGAEQRVVDPADERRRAVGGIEALIRIGVAGEVAVRGHLPARQVDRLEAGAHHLHGLATGERAERANRLVPAQELPEPFGAETRERLLGDDRAAQPHDVAPAVRPLLSLIHI